MGSISKLVKILSKEGDVRLAIVFLVRGRNAATQYTFSLVSSEAFLLRLQS